jgi:hypothetical protein
MVQHVLVDFTLEDYLRPWEDGERLRFDDDDKLAAPLIRPSFPFITVETSPLIEARSNASPFGHFFGRVFAKANVTTRRVLPVMLSWLTKAAMRHEGSLD